MATYLSHVQKFFLKFGWIMAIENLKKYLTLAPAWSRAEGALISGTHKLLGALLNAKKHQQKIWFFHSFLWYPEGIRGKQGKKGEEEPCFENWNTRHPFCWGKIPLVT